jgi:hypothetical protein
VVAVAADKTALLLLEELVGRAAEARVELLQQEQQELQTQAAAVAEVLIVL